MAFGVAGLLCFGGALALLFRQVVPWRAVVLLLALGAIGAARAMVAP